MLCMLRMWMLLLLVVVGWYLMYHFLWRRLGHVLHRRTCLRLWGRRWRVMHDGNDSGRTVNEEG